MLRLPRLGCSIIGLTTGSSFAPAIESMPRCVSPRTGCSTFITSAPHSASTAPAAGTKTNWATSSTRTPFITCFIPLGPFVDVTGREGRAIASGDRALGLPFLDLVPLDTHFHKHDLGVLRGLGRAGGLERFAVPLDGAAHKLERLAAIGRLHLDYNVLRNGLVVGQEILEALDWSPLAAEGLEVLAPVRSEAHT